MINKQRIRFHHIDDLMMGVKKVIENKKSLNETFNLTYGHSESLGTMMKILKRNFKTLK